MVQPWTIVLIACLWLVPSVDTTQAHIHYIYIQIYPKSNSLQILLLDSGGAETSEIFPEIPGSPDTPDLAQSIQTLRV
jgi:hypothetical protein